MNKLKIIRKGYRSLTISITTAFAGQLNGQQLVTARRITAAIDANTTIKNGKID
jgi:hypothetical protein